MKILILGYSDLVQRKVIPAIKKIKNLKFDIASHSKKEQNIGQQYWFRDYFSAIRKSNADIVYISLVNSEHYKLAIKCLDNMKNIIVDKPITLDIKHTENLIKIAKKKNLLISEALVFNYHKQFSLIKKIIKKNKVHVDNILMQFCIPKPKKNNFKLSSKMGGGCFNDMAPYAAAVKRLFLVDNINDVSVYFRNSGKLNTGFTIMISSKITNFCGIFSHDSEYRNDITFFAKSYLIRAERFSAPPSNLKLKVQLKKNNNIREYIVSKDDTFKNYLCEYLDKLKKKDIYYYHKRILDDTKFINKIKKYK